MRDRNNHGQKGIVLVSVLWVVVLLSLLVTSFNAAVRTNITVTRTELDLAKLESVAAAGLELAIARLQTRQGARWIADGRTYAVRFADASLRIRIYDANGRVDVNFASAETLRAILPFVTGSQRLGQELNELIVAKRVAAAQAQQANGTLPPSPDTGAVRVPRIAAFRNVTELLGAPGLSPRHLARLRKYLTVHSSGSGLNLVTAPLDLVPLLPGLSEAQAADVLRVRNENGGATDGPVVPSSPGGDFTDEAGPAYAIVVEVNDGGFAKPITASATIMIDEDDRVPYLALSWQAFGS